MASLTRTIRRAIETRGMNKKQKQLYRYKKKNGEKENIGEMLSRRNEIHSQLESLNN